MNIEKMYDDEVTKKMFEDGPPSPSAMFFKLRGYVDDDHEKLSDADLIRLIAADVQYEQLNGIIDEFKRFTEMAD